MKTIAIANNKGGVGKTSTVLNLADTFARMGRNVLVIDMDPQCNTTSTSKGEITGVYTMHDFLHNECTIKDAIQGKQDEPGGRRYSIVPNDPLLSGRESEFSGDLKMLKLLKRELKTVDDEFDYAIIDTPPQFGYYMTTSLLASDGVVMPLDAEKYAVDGLSQLLRFITDARLENEEMRIYGALVTKVDLRYSETQPFLDQLPVMGEQLGFPVFKSNIRTCSDIKKAQDHVMQVYDYTKHSKALIDYELFAEELEEVINNG